MKTFSQPSNPQMAKHDKPIWNGSDDHIYHKKRCQFSPKVLAAATVMVDNAIKCSQCALKAVIPIVLYF